MIKKTIIFTTILFLVVFLQVKIGPVSVAASEIIKDIYVYTDRDPSSATVVWKTDVNFRGYVWYRETDSVNDNDWNFAVDDQAVKDHAIKLNNLVAGKSYSYYITALDGANMLGQTPIKEFMTLALESTGEKPDLVFRDVYYTPVSDKYYTGDLVMKVCNEGQADFINTDRCEGDTGANWIRWEWKSYFTSFIQDCGSTVIAAGECKEYSAGVAIDKSGMYEFEAMVDPNNYVDEGNGENSNNALYKKIKINLDSNLKPDLVPFVFEIKNSNRDSGEGFRYGDLVDITMGVKNDGEGPSGEFTYKVEGYNSGGSVIRLNVLSLKPGESESYSTRIMWQQDDFQEMVMKLIVDDGNTVEEINENNNVISRTVSIKQVIARNLDNKNKNNAPNIVNQVEQLKDMITPAIERAKKRGKLAIILIGPDYDSIESLRNNIIQLETQISKMKKIIDQIQDESSKEVLNDQINKLQQEKSIIEELIEEQEGKRSLFGWFFKLF